MRVTNSMVLRSTLRDLNGSLARLQNTQADLSTGRTIRKVSDDPGRASSAMATRQQIRRAEQQARTLADAQSWLYAADTALVAGLDMMTRLKQLAVLAGNQGIANESSREAIATEIRGIRDELLSLANTRYGDRTIFSGNQPGPAFDATGTYVGDSGAVVRDIAPNTSVTVNMTGDQVFGDVFQVLDQLAAAIAAGDTDGIAAQHAALDGAATRLGAAAAEIGARATRVDTVKVRADAELTNLRSLLSELEDTDIAEALVRVKAEENAYTASLMAASRVIPPSLLDYLR